MHLPFCWQSDRDKSLSRSGHIRRFARILALTLWRRKTITLATPIQPETAAPVAQRAIGRLHLRAKRRGARSVIGGLRQEGSVKALFPKVRGAALDCVFLNTAGGLTGGDDMRLDVAAEEGAHITVSSQAAERAYRSIDGAAGNVVVDLSVGAGGCIHWLPQETILFDHAALSRTLRVDLAPDATALLVEPIIFGRRAMGEDVQTLSLRDHWRVRRDGKLVFADAIRLQGDAKDIMSGLATGQGAGAVATVLLAGPQAASCAANIDLQGLSGASLIADDLLLVRLLAEDGYHLRRQLWPVMTALSNVPIPRVWSL